ncbi:MAG: DUF456 domain-containing protein [Deltaproteobacteria bacterium]|nr:DUF456 domain-containing protein [Deltaproteobacteria bacterium]
MSYVIFAACLLVMLIALAGTLLPVIPGLPLIFAGYLVYGLYDGWAHYGLWTMVIVGGWVAVSVALDQLATVIGAKKMGAGKAGMIGSFVFAIIGLIFFSLPGLIIGAFGGAALFEMIFNRQELSQALKAGGGALLGLLVGAFFRFLIGLVLTLSFVWLVLIH